MTSPFVYFADERLSAAELSAAALDGHLVALGEGYLVADAVETPGMRAASLARLLDERFALALLSAAWVWGAPIAPPARHTLCRATDRRPAKVRSPRAVLHDLAVRPQDLTRLGGVSTTTPQRTLIDLVRSPRDECHAAAGELAAAGLADAQAALAQVQTAPRIPGMRRAETLLTAFVRGEPPSVRSR